MTSPYGDDPNQYPGYTPIPQPPAYPAQPPAYPAQPPAYPAPVSGQPYPPVSGQPYSPGYMAVTPVSYGFDPVTGQPYSDKSKVVAGLLQLLPGGLLTIGGIGRLYAGNVGLGVAQLVVTAIAWISFFCGFFLVLPFFITFGAWVWFVVDGIIVLAGRPVDGQGRLLRS